MSGFVFMIARCAICRGILTFNPHKVPSINDEPVCGDCIARAQTLQREQHLPVWPDPLPGAYEEMPAEEL